jgi:hypothetical protein
LETMNVSGPIGTTPEFAAHPLKTTITNIHKISLFMGASLFKYQKDKKNE